MIMSVLVLLMSGALFLFYIQTVCEKVLRREFSHAYFKDVIGAIRLEFPKLRNSVASDGSFSCKQARLALKCDFSTLQYLLKNGDPSRRHLTRGERLVGLYFRFLLLSLPIRHALKLKEREAVLKLTTILQYFANSLGESLSVSSLAAAEAPMNS